MGLQRQYDLNVKTAELGKRLTREVNPRENANRKDGRRPGRKQHVA